MTQKPSAVLSTTIPSQVRGAINRMTGVLRPFVTVVVRLIGLFWAFFFLAMTVRLGTLAADARPELAWSLLFPISHLLLGMLLIVRSDLHRPILLALIPLSAFASADERWRLAALCGESIPRADLITPISSVLVLWLVAAFLSAFAQGPERKGKLVVRTLLISSLLVFAHVMRPDPFPTSPYALTLSPCAAPIGSAETF